MAAQTGLKEPQVLANRDHKALNRRMASLCPSSRRIQEVDQSMGRFLQIASCITGQKLGNVHVCIRARMPTIQPFH